MTYQEDTWSGEFGLKYNKRNDYSFEEYNRVFFDLYGHQRVDMMNDFIGDLPKDARILEVGCNFGGQLIQLQNMGFSNLYGLELQWDAVKRSITQTSKINILQGSGTDIPFKDGYFDLVFTFGVLIHISPNIIGSVMKEIVRVANNLIWGFEYYNPEYIELQYHNQPNLMWKGNFAKIYNEKTGSNLTFLKEVFYPYQSNPSLIDQMFLLKKP